MTTHAIDHLCDSKRDHEQYEVKLIFPMHKDRKYKDCKLFVIMFPKLKLL